MIATPSQPFRVLEADKALFGWLKERLGVGFRCFELAILATEFLVELIRRSENPP
jgi:hypothetical protein